MSLEQLIKQEIKLEDDLIYLNHAAVAPWPSRTTEAVKQFADENNVTGAKRYLEWVKIETSLREQFAQIIHAPSVDDIALVKNTSEALSFVAYGLNWKSGENVVISNQEFPSNSIIWHSLKEKGVEVREVNLAQDKSPEDALIAAIDNKTKLLSISSVQYATGLKMNLDYLGEACRNKNILFCVDAIQSIGAIPFDTQSIQADFVMADTHKWMLGPEGIALFYCRESIREQLKLHEYGWHMLENMGDYAATEWNITQTARRFECGSPNMLGIHAANASLSLLLELGIDAIEKRLLERTAYLIEKINAANNLELITHADEKRLAGIITFRSLAEDSQSLYQRLMKNNVICAPRGGGIRFSPHFYTAFEDILAAIQLADLTG
jgi:selenocysteine lyase/cysteine desulfurase